MPCAELQIGNITAVVCGLPKRKRCVHCGKPSAFLCDYLVNMKRGKWKTCDLPLCSTHARKGVSDDVHFCQTHFGLAKAAYERRNLRKMKVEIEGTG